MKIAIQAVFNAMVIFCRAKCLTAFRCSPIGGRALTDIVDVSRRFVPHYFSTPSHQLNRVTRLNAIKGPVRYSSKHWLECILTIPTSRVLARTCLQIILFTAWSAFLTWLHMTGRKNLAIPAIMHTTLGSALSLLLVFRTNSGYDRYMICCPCYSC